MRLMFWRRPRATRDSTLTVAAHPEDASTHYGTLGVSRDATQHEIVQAYRRLAKADRKSVV